MFDLAVVGLGPGGMEAVRIALKNNLSVIAFEKANIGGCCLNVGCIPTKAILHSAKTYLGTKKFDKIGLKLNGEIGFDWNKILDRKDEIVNKFKKASENALSKSMTLVKSEAELIVENGEVKIKADSSTYSAKNIIVSTGSIPRELPDLKFDGQSILSSDDLYNLKKLPKSLAIIGSGAIGIEWGFIMSAFGVETTIIEKMPSLCPSMDLEISKRIERILKQNNINFYKNDYSVSYIDGKLTLESGNTVNAEKILVAVGRKPILPNAVKEIDFSSNSRYETNFNNLFVIGDSTGFGMLAHSASADSQNVMNKILFNKNYEDNLIPAVIYTNPEIATIGIKEQDIDDSYTVKKLPVASVAKSWADDSTDGFIKLIIKDNVIKGACIISNEASSLIAVIGEFILNKTPVTDIEKFVFPHPSYSELISEVIKRG